MPRWLYLTAGLFMALLIFSVYQNQKGQNDSKNSKYPSRSYTPSKPTPYYSPSPKPPALIATTPTPSKSPKAHAELTKDQKESIIDQLQSIGESYDPEFLAQVAPWLSNPDKDVRTAAMNAILLIGDSAGASLLRKAVNLVDDPREASVLLDNADYLELPPSQLGKPIKSVP